MQENPGPHYPDNRGPLPYGAAPSGIPYQPQPWFLPSPAGVRFDHLARNPAAQLWRSIVGTLLVAVGFLAIGVVVVVAFTVPAFLFGLPSPVDPETGAPEPTPLGLAMTLLSIAPALVLVFGVAALIQRRRPGTLSSVAGRLRWSWLMSCVGLALAAMVLGQAAQWLVLANSGQDAAMFGWAGWE
ncbi:CPBP family intramembrane metalloprotease domain-containing protein, partial [Nonomuraea terrae]